MSLVSLYFLLFLAVVTLVYYLLPGKVQWVWLLLAGLAFYALCSYGLLIVPVLDAVIVYFFGKYFETKKQKLLMLLELILLFGILILLKYAGRIGAGWSGFLKDFGFGQIAVYAVPIGLSYFTIMAVAYSVDVFRGTIQAEKNFAKLLLFLTFFPVMTQGPILRYDEVSRQLVTPHRFSYQNLTFGVQRILWGLFKKLVISERFAVVSMTITEGWGSSAYSGIWVIASFFAFSFRLYMDFSGCIDIVIGTAEILGIRLPENFNHSYLSRTIPEFWRRWHITLGTWLKDYVMYSITMSRPAKQFAKKAGKKIGRKTAATIVTCIGILFVWLVYALWHDISAVFLVSGAFYAVIIILGTVFDPLIKKFRKRFASLVESVPYKIFMTVRTLILSTIGAFFVFMPTVRDGAAYLASIFKTPTGAVMQMAKGSSSLLEATFLGLDLPDLIILVLAFVFWIVVSRMDAKKDPRVWLSERNIAVRWIILLLLIVVVVLFGKYGGFDTGSFVYQAF
ncbi:MAG: MBOAT family O-acyltransferase [Lachnospiraceae bacterium]|nr:MBOAT family O-acyltransferase [Lachnospiraceae bacterium]